MRKSPTIRRIEGTKHIERDSLKKVYTLLGALSVSEWKSSEEVQTEGYMKGVPLKQDFSNGVRWTFYMEKVAQKHRHYLH